MKQIGVTPKKKHWSTNLVIILERERESLELSWYTIAIEWNN